MFVLEFGDRPCFWLVMGFGPNPLGSIDSDVLFVIFFFRGEAWHRLRNEDFSQVDLGDYSKVLVDLIRKMMRTEPRERLKIEEVELYPVVERARLGMERRRVELRKEGKNMWGGSPLASVPTGFLLEILGENMDTS